MEVDTLGLYMHVLESLIECEKTLGLDPSSGGLDLKSALGLYLCPPVWESSKNGPNTLHDKNHID